jgi:hypothetical protein
MLQRIILIFFIGLSLSACSRFTKSGRQERAYRNYIHKSQATRVKQRSRLFHRPAELASFRARAETRAEGKTPEAENVSSRPGDQ